MPNYPHVIIDLRHRSLEVILNDGVVAGTLELDDAHLVDVDAEHRPVALEILALDDLKIDEMGERFGFSDQVPAIRAEITKVMTPQTAAASAVAEPMVIQGTSSIDPAGASATADDAETPLIAPVEITLTRN
jgi:hypothetical protein